MTSTCWTCLLISSPAQQVAAVERIQQLQQLLAHQRVAVQVEALQPRQVVQVALAGHQPQAGDLFLAAAAVQPALHGRAQLAVFAFADVLGQVVQGGRAHFEVAVLEQAQHQLLDLLVPGVDGLERVQGVAAHEAVAAPRRQHVDQVGDLALVLEQADQLDADVADLPGGAGEVEADLVAVFDLVEVGVGRHGVQEPERRQQGERGSCRRPVALFFLEDQDAGVLQEQRGEEIDGRAHEGQRDAEDDVLDGARVELDAVEDELGLDDGDDHQQAGAEGLAGGADHFAGGGSGAVAAQAALQDRDAHQGEGGVGDRGGQGDAGEAQRRARQPDDQRHLAGQQQEVEDQGAALLQARGEDARGQRVQAPADEADGVELQGQRRAGHRLGAEMRPFQQQRDDGVGQGDHQDGERRQQEQVVAHAVDQELSRPLAVEQGGRTGEVAQRRRSMARETRVKGRRKISMAK